jgi:hypothetical protein
MVFCGCEKNVNLRKNPNFYEKMGKNQGKNSIKRVVLEQNIKELRQNRNVTKMLSPIATYRV